MPSVKTVGEFVMKDGDLLGMTERLCLGIQCPYPLASGRVRSHARRKKANIVSIYTSTSTVLSTCSSSPSSGKWRFPGYRPFPILTFCFPFTSTAHASTWQRNPQFKFITTHHATHVVFEASSECFRVCLFSPESNVSDPLGTSRWNGRHWFSQRVIHGNVP